MDSDAHGASQHDSDTDIVELTTSGRTIMTRIASRGRLAWNALADLFRRLACRHSPAKTDRRPVTLGSNASQRGRPHQATPPLASVHEAQPAISFVRVGHVDRSVYLDLCTPAGEIVEITAEQWTIIRSAPIRFDRPDGMLPLPRPVSGGSLNAARPLLATIDDQDWILIAAWLVGAINPTGPYPILALIGEQGTAKSTTSRLLRRLLDPHTCELRMMSGNAQDLAIAAQHSHILGFDNVSRLRPEQSDALCQLATGGAFGTRQLYTDQRQVLIRAKRPIIFNGIDEFIERADLRDRCIRVDLPVIPPSRRCCESDLVRAFDQVHAGVLGALCDAACMALRNRDQTVVAELPRMADFARWVVAAEPALPWNAGEFIHALRASAHRALRMGVLDDPICGAVHDMVPPGTNRWEGTIQEFMTQLHHSIPHHVRRAAKIPSNSLNMRSHLRRIAPAMRSGMGIEITTDDGGLTVVVSRIAEGQADAA